MLKEKRETPQTSRMFQLPGKKRRSLIEGLTLRGDRGVFPLLVIQKKRKKESYNFQGEG